ncbi:MAG: hypothetical protein DMG24_14025 [Acidobacteria bacterium]|nr:MAG: hypothetical protein DMG24_14025 [Acidobacteriota bacterium]
MKTRVQLAAAREGRRWSSNRRRRGGNVEIARLGFGRDFQARWEGWKSPVSLRRRSGSWAGLFHAFHGASFPQRLPTTPFLDAPRRGTERFGGGFWAHSCWSKIFLL